MEITNFVTWDFIATYGGLALVTMAVTQVTKAWVSKFIPTELWSYLVALVLLLASTYFTGALTMSSGVLCFVNALLAMLTANGGYDKLSAIFSKVNSK